VSQQGTLSYAEDGSSRFLQNTGTYLLNLNERDVNKGDINDNTMKNTGASVKKAFQAYFQKWQKGSN
jgi:hypothetical protein